MLCCVYPGALLRWHRQMFRLYWWKKSIGVQKKPKIVSEIIQLIRQMAKENRLWGAERIQGELLKLGIKISKRLFENQDGHELNGS
jgi:putative transposase